MAEAKVIVSLPTIDESIKALNTTVLETGMQSGAAAAAGRIKEMWTKGKTGEGGSLEPPRITSQYKKYKESKGKNGVIDFKMTGDLSNSFGVKSVKQNTAIISFRADQLPKARGLMNPDGEGREKWTTRPQGLEVGDKLTAIASNFFNKWLRTVVKFQK